ncbi:hypothetical protein NSK_005510 [Nannochloropsis salina CCMP1776]|uniref:Uncharacterized protein n=1 Tax=Nannochloropsis salina CCMP1776 TaxID=1027361 RepID=A0A4D9D0V1_9STRA|nr:hypothetical protein NSK_005510 [Nannochloropsis salina CCMP1776]|eukprot:TFJ83175.1 hypothetical protein NSK_005510 [Nannochloropsis salina CCMP1776]
MRVRYSSALLLALSLASTSFAIPPTEDAATSATANGAASALLGDLQNPIGDPGDVLAGIIHENWDSIFKKESGGVKGLLHRKRQLLSELGLEAADADSLEVETDAGTEGGLEGGDEEQVEHDGDHRHLQLTKIFGMNPARTGPSLQSKPTRTWAKPDPKPAKTKSSSSLFGRKSASTLSNGVESAEASGPTQGTCAWQMRRERPDPHIDVFSLPPSLPPSGINMEGGPTMDTIDDGAITRFYEAQTPRGETWNRKFSMVVGDDMTRTCGVYNASTDLFLSNSFKGSQVDFWAILNRQLVPKATHTNAIDQSFGSARLICSAQDRAADACRNPGVLKEVLGKYYPKVQWYTCGSDGELVPVKSTLLEKLEGQ